MRHTTTAFAAALAILLLSACAKKDEAPAEAPAYEQAAPVDTAPAEPAPMDAAPTDPPPADENSDDAEQTGGDKVKP